jgi:hypothetical protein
MPLLCDPIIPEQEPMSAAEMQRMKEEGDRRVAALQAYVKNQK